MLSPYVAIGHSIIRRGCHRGSWRLYTGAADTSGVGATPWDIIEHRGLPPLDVRPIPHEVPRRCMTTKTDVRGDRGRRSVTPLGFPSDRRPGSRNKYGNDNHHRFVPT